MEIQETVIDTIRSRPRFKAIAEVARKEYVEYLKRAIEKHPVEFAGIINEEVSIITVRSARNHFWKPCLTIRSEIVDNHEVTEITGVFGPSSTVWTFFMFLYLVFGRLSLVFIMLWFVDRQLESNDFSWALLLSFVSLFCLLSTYLATKIGQHLATHEMQKLRKFAEASIWWK